MCATDPKGMANHGKVKWKFINEIGSLKETLKKWNEKTGCDLGSIKIIEEKIKEMDDLSDKRKLSEEEEEKKEVRRLNVELLELVKFR